LSITQGIYSTSKAVIFHLESDDRFKSLFLRASRATNRAHLAWKRFKARQR